MDLGIGLFVIFIFGVLLFIFVAFGLSFVKNRYVSTVGFFIFIIVSAYLSYATAHETRLGGPIDMYSTEQIIIAYVPFIACVMAIGAAVLWLKNRKKLARWLGVISILSTIYVYLQI